MKELVFIFILLGNFTVTSYRSIPAQTDSTPFITSTGSHVHKDGVAVSQDLLKQNGGPARYGDLIFIEGHGFKVINDCMHKRKEKAVDMWVSTYKEEKAIGLQKRNIWLIKMEKSQKK